MNKVEEYLKLKKEEGNEFFNGYEEIARDLQKKAKSLFDTFSKEELIALKKQTPSIYGRMALQKRIKILEK